MRQQGCVYPPGLLQGCLLMDHRGRVDEFMEEYSRRLLRSYVRKGSEEAFSRLVDRYLRLVYTTCLREIRDPDLASDATQATFLILARKSNNLKIDKSMASWLFATAFNVSRSLKRQEMRRLQLEKQISSSGNIPITNIDESQDKQFILDLLNRAMKKLGNHEIALLEMRFYQEYSLQEIGKVLGVSEDAARKRVVRAIEHLRKAYRQLGVTVTAMVLIDLFSQQGALSMPSDIAVTITSVASGSLSCSLAMTPFIERTAFIMKIAQFKYICGLGAVLLIGVGVSAVVVNIKSKPMAVYQRKNPNPNAYDYYMRSAKAIQYRNTITAYNSVSLPNDSSQAVSANDTAIKTMHEGFKYACEIPVDRDTLEDSVGLRQLGRLCALRSRVLSASGDYKGASDAAIDAIKVGADIPHGGDIVMASMGQVLDTFGKKAAVNTISSLSASDAIDAVHRLQEINATRVDASEIIATEAYFANRNMDKNPTQYLFIRGSYNSYLNELIHEASKPYPQRKSITPKGYAKIIAPIYAPIFVKIADDQAQMSMLTIFYALHAYHNEHKTFPKNLNELVPRYLDNVPNDPFTVSSPISYQLTDNNYILYSVGPDGIDNKGVAINDTSAKNPISVTEKSQGDIIFGMNN